MTQVNEAIDGKKLIELLMQALDEGDSVRITKYVNQMLSQKVSECLQDRRVLISEELFTEDLATDLVKVSNLNRNKDSDAPELEDEQLPNMELATDDLATDDTFDEARPAQPKFKVGNAVDVEVGFGKFEKGTVTKVGPRQLDGIWVKMTKTKKTTNFPIGLVAPRGQPRKIVDEGSESVGLDTFRE